MGSGGLGNTELGLLCVRARSASWVLLGKGLPAATAYWAAPPLLGKLVGDLRHNSCCAIGEAAYLPPNVYQCILDPPLGTLRAGGLQISSKEQLHLLQRFPAAQAVVHTLRPAFLELAAVPRGSLLGPRCSFEGLRKATRDPAGAVYELQLGS